jgi:hypothetical protein
MLRCDLVAHGDPSEMNDHRGVETMLVHVLGKVQIGDKGFSNISPESINLGCIENEPADADSAANAEIK